jgi:predicted DNA-binding protein
VSLRRLDMIITIDIPDSLNRKLEAAKRKTGLSKSYLVRQIILEHYQREKEKKAA